MSLLAKRIRRRELPAFLQQGVDFRFSTAH
jgi:hypothetical protein